MRDGPLVATRDGAVLSVRLNRPEKLNALDRPMLVGLLAALEGAVSDRTVGALLLTGTGRAFCSGADLAAVAGPERDAFLDLLLRTFQVVWAYPKPVVAALNGITVAGGLELALGCDLILAADSARIGDGHLPNGLVPGGGAVSLLPAVIGLPRARQLLLTGDLLPASELAAWGLVSRVVPDQELAREGADQAARLAALPPGAVATTKRLLGYRADAALRRDAEAMRAHLSTSEAAEAFARFLG